MWVGGEEGRQPPSHSRTELADEEEDGVGDGVGRLVLAPLGHVGEEFLVDGGEVEEEVVLGGSLYRGFVERGSCASVASESGADTTDERWVGPGEASADYTGLRFVLALTRHVAETRGG
jgi:hypothetical protein